MNGLPSRYGPGGTLSYLSVSKIQQKGTGMTVASERGVVGEPKGALPAGILVLGTVMLTFNVGCVWPPPASSCPAPNVNLHPQFDANSASISNPWVGPFNVGDSQTFSGYGSFAGRKMTYSITGTGTLLGVACLIVHYEHTANAAYRDQKVVDAYMAQDTVGNVWVLKSDSLANAELFFPANPKPGDVYLSAGYGDDAYLEIIATDATVPQVSANAPVCSKGLQVRWTRNCGTSDIDIDSEWLCSSIGVVVKTWNDGGGTNGWVRD